MHLRCAYIRDALIHGILQYWKAAYNLAVPFSEEGVWDIPDSRLQRFRISSFCCCYSCGGEWKSWTDSVVPLRGVVVEWLPMFEAEGQFHCSVEQQIPSGNLIWNSQISGCWSFDMNSTRSKPQGCSCWTSHIVTQKYRKGTSTTRVVDNHSISHTELS